MHTREMEADDDGNVMTEVVVVTTDIDAPKAVPFAEFENAAGTATQPLNADEEGTAATDGAVAYDLGSGALSATDDGQAAILANMMSASWAPGTGTSVVHTFLPAAEDGDPDTDGNQPREAAQVPGSYNGASGTYTCSGDANCTVTVNSDGDLTAATDGWIFTPDAGATSDEPDYVYYHYGFWLQSTKDAGGDVTSYDEVETFAGSSVAASGDVSAVRGTASYSGGATGVYVHTTSKLDGSRLQATSGHFTADASLKATFDQIGEDPGQAVDATSNLGTIPPNQLFTLTSTINNFELSGGEDQMWSVRLEGDITPGTGTASGGSIDDGDAWNASFHGPVAAVDGVVPHPHSVVGEFNASFTNGTVAGAFGANRVDDD